MTLASGSDPTKQPATLTPGICSVTLRSHSIDEVVALAVEAGLAGIEWGADVHVVDAASADHARLACAAAGLKVLSLGSYYRAGDFGDFDGVVSLAVRVGAPRVRIWAGTLEPDDADQQLWEEVVADTRRIAATAAEHGLQLAFEYHGGTLTSTLQSTVELIDRVGLPNVGTYWQPAVGLSDEEALDSLHQLIGHVAGVHCFSWWPGTDRLPLEGRKELWQAVSRVLREHGRGMDLMLEFVAGDLPDNVVRDAGFLHGIAAYGS
jgi:3-dehydroshikimate dehydratase